ncbi:MAG: DUF1156 domain-containing protein, partial [Deltaproteobacteria bacterium]|nr:DUF1156 domain-containing protein [Deltaproteobacteria bacterium]
MNKKLIETALPLEAISQAAKRERNIRRGHPSTFHLWWSRKPLAAARAVLFASIVDDPSSHPELYPTEAAQTAERERLFELLKKLIVWENTNNPQILAAAQTELKKYLGPNPPELLDPFAGGGSIPLEAQRLGLKVQASDLNPVAVIINKAMVEIPPKFAGRAPINPLSLATIGPAFEWPGAAGLAEDVAYYADRLSQMVWAKVGNLYPDPILEPGLDLGLDNISPKDKPPRTVAWIWARTVRCPNPACGQPMPLVSSFALVNRGLKRISAEPAIRNNTISYGLRKGPPAQAGTINRHGARCAFCNGPVSLAYIRAEGLAQRLGNSMMAVVVNTSQGKIYLPPNEASLLAATVPRSGLSSDQAMPPNALGFRTPLYGLKRYADLFSPRQLTFLNALGSSIPELQKQIELDAQKAGWAISDLGLEAGGLGAKAYSEALVVYLGVLIDKMADYHSTLCVWDISLEKIAHTFTRQALPMVWDYAEGNPFSGATGSLKNMTEWIVKALRTLPANNPAVVTLAAAQTRKPTNNFLISTDPPYYDNIGYGDLSDFFYIWLRKSLKNIYPSVFKTILSPKNEELVAAADRCQGDKLAAKNFFEAGLKRVFANFYQIAADDFPITIYYAFKESQAQGPVGEAKFISNGWETMLSALIEAGLVITGTWPIKTEMGARLRSLGSNALASSIVLVCRKRPPDAPPLSRRDFLSALRTELRRALARLRQANIAPVDLAQAAIGPGMAVYSRYSQILSPDGAAMPVRVALGLINEELDKFLAEPEESLDPDSAFCVALFA